MIDVSGAIQIFFTKGSLWQLFFVEFYFRNCTIFIGLKRRLIFNGLVNSNRCKKYQLEPENNIFHPSKLFNINEHSCEN